MSPTLERILVYPVKSLDPHTLSQATVRTDGGLSYDREFAIVDSMGAYVNGKNDPRVHRLRSAFDPAIGELTLDPPDDNPATFDVDDRTELETWLSAYFDTAVELRRDETGGFPDDTLASGPTVISRATLETVADWFDDIDAAEMERRLRPNLVLSDVEPFWEDRLYRDHDTAVEFRIGDCTFIGSNPCQRCVVPTRDPDTGEETPGFRETFIRRRKETLPHWVDDAWYDHYFRLMVNTFVPEEAVGTRIHVGDGVEILGERPYPA